MSEELIHSPAFDPDPEPISTELTIVPLPTQPPVSFLDWYNHVGQEQFDELSARIDREERELLELIQQKRADIRVFREARRLIAIKLGIETVEEPTPARPVKRPYKRKDPPPDEPAVRPKASDTPAAAVNRPTAPPLAASTTGRGYEFDQNESLAIMQQARRVAPDKDLVSRLPPNRRQSRAANAKADKNIPTAAEACFDMIREHGPVPMNEMLETLMRMDVRRTDGQAYDTELRIKQALSRSGWFDYVGYGSNPKITIKSYEQTIGDHESDYEEDDDD
jgi:hypothetical protein